MRKTLAVFATALALAATTSVASARSGIQLEPTTTTLSMPAFTYEFGIGTGIRCDVTFDLALHPRVGKVASSLAGTFDIAVGDCTEGELGVLVGGSRRAAGGPYHLTYQSFTGTLPNISSITFRLNDVHIWFKWGGFLECLSDGPVDIGATTTGGNPFTGIAITSQQVPIAAEFLCDVSAIEITASGSLSSSVRMTLF